MRSHHGSRPKRCYKHIETWIRVSGLCPRSPSPLGMGSSHEILCHPYHGHNDLFVCSSNGLGVGNARPTYLGIDLNSLLMGFMIVLLYVSIIALIRMFQRYFGRSET